MVFDFDSRGGPSNYRDASSTAPNMWKNDKPTVIQVPAPGEVRKALNTDSPSVSHQRRPPKPHDNPYFRATNTLEPSSHRRRQQPHDISRTSHHFQHNSPRPGNPNVLQTVLAKPVNKFDPGTDHPARKRPRIDNGITSHYDGIPPLRASGHGTLAGVFNSRIEPHSTITNHSNPVRYDPEVIDLQTSSEDVGELVPRASKSPSPDPINITAPHPFETHPAEYSISTSNKGKGRVKESSQLVVEGSEEDEDIEEFSPSDIGRMFKLKKSTEIPKNIVMERRIHYESRPPSAPAAIRLPVEKVKSVDLTSGTVIGKMKKKDEAVDGKHGSTGIIDRVGTSSSNFVNSARERLLNLPLDAWCLGLHRFRHSATSPLKLSYEGARQQIKVTWGQPPTHLEFKLDRDVDSAMIVNDTDRPLSQNVVVKLTTTKGDKWKGTERKYKGFKGGGNHGQDLLVFVFSTAKSRGFSATDYQRFVTGIRKALEVSRVQTISPQVGGAVWELTAQYAEMFEQRESRKSEADRNESVADRPSAPVRSATPCSSTSVKTRTSNPEPRPPNEDIGPSLSHRRSARQSAMRTSKTSPLHPPPAPAEPDEVILMYPPTGTGALSVMQSDLRRLQPEEYLNDTLIEFGLKLWLNGLREKNPVLADQIHVFSSFFYKKLNNKKNPEDGYKSVRKWTAKAELFNKKYVIIPINENVHWYLAIIYEPGHTLEPPLAPSQISNPRMTRNQKQLQGRVGADTEAGVTSESPEMSLERSSSTALVTGEPEADIASMDATRITTPSTARNEEMDVVAITTFDKSCSIAVESSSEVQMRDPSPPELLFPPSDWMDVDANVSVNSVVSDWTPNIVDAPEPSTSKLLAVPVSKFYESGSEREVVKPVTTVSSEDSAEDQQQEAEVDDMLAVTPSSGGDLPSQTYIFTFDSLGARHPQAIRVLKNYLASEAKDKQGFDEIRSAVGKQVQVPVQPNTWDCGIYLLQFVKVFMNEPLAVLEQILSTRGTMPSSERKKLWQDHEIPQFRENLKDRIIQLSEEWKASRDIEADKRRNGNVIEVEALSSEGEVDIVEDVPIAKATLGRRQQQPATRLRG